MLCKNTHNIRHTVAVYNVYNMMIPMKVYVRIMYVSAYSSYTSEYHNTRTLYLSAIVVNYYVENLWIRVNVYNIIHAYRYPYTIITVRGFRDYCW